MKIALRVDRTNLRRWHLRLAERLAGRERAWVSFQFVEGEQSEARANTLRLFQIETTLFGLGRAGVSERIGVEDLNRFARRGASEPDLVIDLASSPLPLGRGVWRVECDGAGLDDGLLSAILARRAPEARIVTEAGVVACARPGAERMGLAKATFEEMLERAATLIACALDGAGAAELPALADETTSAAAPLAFSAKALAKTALARVKQRAMRVVYAKLFHAPHWRVGWRRQRAQGAAGGLGGGWSDLPDDGRRFYADPFPIEWRGRSFLFVEDFEHAKGKGVISVVEFGPNGPIGAPRPVLERPEHLSYPFVFERDGEMWMIPESGGAGTIDLYRATNFPDGWKHEATLVDGVVASDATIVEWQGRFWMFATVRDGGGSYCDALHLWSAPDFRGPWTPHAKNPVLIDIASARPAGRMAILEGSLFRPVQDCREGYGAALGLARVDRLDEGGFAQTVETILRPGAEWPGRRLHTFNAAGGFEFIDGSAFAPRWAALRRPAKAALDRRAKPFPRAARRAVVSPAD
jgi:hypothetical protein